MKSLAERLGHSADTRLVILSCDDLGASHASNVGVFEAIHTGAATCASLMVPAPWACHAANNVLPDDDIGVHLTLNAEHSCYRWGPITHSPSLQSGEGGFPRTLADLWEHADQAEVLRELRAQIERAMAWGVDVTHLAPHLSAITLRPSSSTSTSNWRRSTDSPSGCPQRSVPRRRAFHSASSPPMKASSSLITSTTTGAPGVSDRVFDAIASLQPGVTEIHIQPAIDTPEVRAFAGRDADGWIADLALATSDELPTALADSGAVMIGFRDLRDVMRSV